MLKSLIGLLLLISSTASAMEKPVVEVKIKCVEGYAIVITTVYIQNDIEVDTLQLYHSNKDGHYGYSAQPLKCEK